MKAIQVILGNMTFHHFTDEELALFKTDTDHKALIHEVEEVKYFNTLEEAYDEVDNTYADSWLIPSEFNGEMVFERAEDKKRCKL
ncbi:MAG: hypothetical protein PQJ49_06260 [Sphaerochaetaceae bacterium]|nr:hypothetical protein [Sphaerochaetaceae bacterium]